MAHPPIFWLDSFMAYSSAQGSMYYPLGFAANTIDNAGGRGGRGALNVTGSGTGAVSLAVPGGTTLVILGVAIKPVIQFAINFATGVALTQELALVQSVSHPYSRAVPANVWTYLEARVYCHASAGTVDVWLDETNVLSLTGLNTSTAAGTIKLSASGAYADHWYASDLYAAGSTTSTDEPYGDRAVTWIGPTGNGTHSDFVGADGNSVDNYLQVNAIPPDPATKYVRSSTPGAIDSYAMANLPASAAGVEAVVAKWMASKTDAGSRAVAPLFRIGGTDYPGTGQSLSTSTRGYSEVFMENPDTSSAWAVADVNGAEAGVKVTA